MKTIFAVLSIALFLAGCAGTAGTPPAGEGTTGDVNLGVHNPNAERFSSDAEDGEDGDGGDAEGDSEE